MHKKRSSEDNPEGAPGGGRGVVPQARNQRRAFYTWRTKCGGMEVSDARKLKALEDETAS
jgi:hypothetical protein